MTSDLKISIITVCFNAEKTIEATIQSVFSQSYKNIEYVIIDGASQDKTMDIIHRYRDRIDRITSERDQGLYDAMNKGTRLSSGDVIFFLNADDRFYDHSVVSDIAKVFSDNQDAEMIYGNLSFCDIPPGLWFDPHEYNRERKKILDVIVHAMPHQATFARRSTFKKVGGFDTRFPVGADYDWFLRCWKTRIKTKYIDRDIAVFSYSGKSVQQRYIHIPERIHLVYKNASFPIFILYAVIATVRFIWKILYEYILWPIRTGFQAKKGDRV